MTQTQALTESRLRSLADWLNGLTWPLSGDSVRELAEENGWRLLYSAPNGVSWDTGLVEGSRSNASVTILDGYVSRLSITASEVVLEETSISISNFRDIFADQVVVLTGIWGRPLDRELGREPTASWVLASGCKLTVMMIGVSCDWVLRSPEFVLIEADLERR